MSDSTAHIVVTGASQGVGAAIARKAAASFPGARLSLLARSKERLEDVASDCRDLGAEASVYAADLTVEPAVRKACEKLIADSGPPTLFVNNAGMFEPGGVVDTTLEKWRFQMDVNLTSAYLMTNGLLPSMLEAGSGHVVYIVSVAAIRGYPRGVAYCASKHGLLGLARAVREETKEAGIRITAMLPGAMRTPSWDGTDLPDSRFVMPEDLAAAVMDVHRLSRHAVVEEMLIRPQLGDI